MSMPEPTPPPVVDPSTDVVTQPGTAGRATRTTRVTWWIGGRFGELVGVTVPGILAVTVSPWWVIVSGVVALVWTAHEYRVRHRGGERS